MEHVSQPSAEKLQELRDKASAKFGEAALFTYRSPLKNPDGTPQFDSNGQPVEADFTLKFDQALDICGEHISEFPVDAVVTRMLARMRERTLSIHELDKTEGTAHLHESIIRGEEKYEEIVAKRATAQE